jgi:hypothetical protein
MSLNYYLFCRDAYNIIIRKLENIISIIEEVDEYTKKEVNLLETDIAVENERHNLLFFSSRKEHMQLLRETYNKKIMDLCNHEFIEDTIDITPDRSQNIRYCSICEYTETNY